jgi:hypothetical protein
VSSTARTRSKDLAGFYTCRQIKAAAPERSRRRFFTEDAEEREAPCA